MATKLSQILFDHTINEQHIYYLKYIDNKKKPSEKNQAPLRSGFI